MHLFGCTMLVATLAAAAAAAGVTSPAAAAVRQDVPACAQLTDFKLYWTGAGVFKDELHAVLTTAAGTPCADVQYVVLFYANPGMTDFFAGAARVGRSRFRVTGALKWIPPTSGRVVVCALTVSDGTTILDTWGFADGWGSGCVGITIPPTPFATSGGAPNRR